MKADKAIVIGRFQPFTVGHKALLDKALQEAHSLIMIIGSATEARSVKNPFTASERQAMIEAVYPTDSIQFIHQADSDYSNPDWCNSLVESVNALVSSEETVKLVGYFKDYSSYYLHLFPNWGLVSVDSFENGISATEVREAIFGSGTASEVEAMVPKEVSKYLFGWAMASNRQDFLYVSEEYATVQDKYKKPWKNSPYEPTFVTGDAVVVCNSHVLLITRKDSPGKGLNAIPGGFLEPTESIRACAIRELVEETGIDVPESVLHDSVVGRENFDLPGRDVRGRFITEAYLLHLKGFTELPKVKALDDAASARWVNLNELKNMEGTFFADHLHIINYFLNLYPQVTKRPMFKDFLKDEGVASNE